MTGLWPPATAEYHMRSAYWKDEDQTADCSLGFCQNDSDLATAVMPTNSNQHLRPGSVCLTVNECFTSSSPECTMSTGSSTEGYSPYSSDKTDILTTYSTSTCHPSPNIRVRIGPVTNSRTDTGNSKLYSDEEEDLISHKPYAKLIYEALLAMPGHKMMLKDIYEWFQRNTTKPQESGSNGWQNSIRHNLSMNKVCNEVL